MAIKRRLGDISELKAVIWLWEQGYEVFTNVAGDGPIDLLIVDSEGHAFSVDVKKLNPYTSKDGHVKYYIVKPSETQQKLNIKFLLDTPTGFLWAEEIENPQE